MDGIDQEQAVVLHMQEPGYNLIFHLYLADVGTCERITIILLNLENLLLSGSELLKLQGFSRERPWPYPCFSQNLLVYGIEGQLSPFETGTCKQVG